MKSSGGKGVLERAKPSAKRVLRLHSSTLLGPTGLDRAYVGLAHQIRRVNVKKWCPK